MTPGSLRKACVKASLQQTDTGAGVLPTSAMTTGRKNIMLGTAGHVDHGKSTLVKLLTGCETDTLAEEKQRGLTIDLGFAKCKLADERIVGVVDVPGHVDFIRNMVAGAHGIDVVIFVVAADDGIMPQTREHLQILSLMGLKHGLVALTKIDLVEPPRRELVIGELRELLSDTFLAQAPICPMSNITGEGFGEFFDSLNDTASKCEERPSSGLFRMWLGDVFTLRGPGTVITGIPSSGTVRVGDTLKLCPSGLTGRVRRMQAYGEDATEGRAGECVALNIPEIGHENARRGMVLAIEPGSEAVSMAEGELQILPSIKREVEDLLEVHAHIGTASVIARLAFLENPTMTGGQKQMVQLRFAEPLPLVTGERFVLRANVGETGLVTIGGGRILNLSNTRWRRNKRWTVEALAARRAAIDDPERWCELMLRESRLCIPSELALKCRFSHAQLDQIIQKLISTGRVVRLPSAELVHMQTVENAARKMLAALETFHAANPQRAGLSREEFLAPGAGPPGISAAAAELLLASRQIQFAGAVYAKHGWSAQLQDPDEKLCKGLCTTFQKAGFAGPTPLELSASMREPLPRIEKLLRLLVERGELVPLEGGGLIHRDALEAARQLTLQLFRKKPLFSTMDFRDAVGVSRKYAVPLLDTLDKQRFTVRTGHDRTPGVEAKKLLSAG